MIFAETEKTELKQKFNDILPKEIVAFLNTDGGSIYIGVNDDGTVCGVQNLDESLKRVADILENQILPDLRNAQQLHCQNGQADYGTDAGENQQESLFFFSQKVY